MLPGYKRKGTIAAVALVISAITLGVIATSYRESQFHLITLPFWVLGNFILLGYTFTSFAVGKGYSALLGIGLAFLGPVGLIVLLLLADKHTQIS